MMSRRHGGFAFGVVFAALAGLAFVPVVKVARAWIDSTTAGAMYFTIVTALHVALLGATRSHRLGALVLVLGLGLTSAILAESLMPTTLALTAALACSRARILYRGRIERPWFVELAIAIIALVAVELVVTHSLKGIALSIWAYWLVQSAYFLVPARGDGSEARGGADPFDVAVERAAELMDDTR